MPRHSRRSPLDRVEAKKFPRVFSPLSVSLADRLHSAKGPRWRSATHPDIISRFFFYYIGTWWHAPCAPAPATAAPAPEDRRWMNKVRGTPCCRRVPAAFKMWIPRDPPSVWAVALTLLSPESETTEVKRRRRRRRRRRLCRPCTFDATSIAGANCCVNRSIRRVTIALF